MSEFLDYLSFRRDHLIGLALEHVQVVGISIAIATALGVLLGILVYRTDRAARVVLGVTGAFLTVPSFALFALLIPIFGLGFQPTVVALVMYALLPIVRNTITGLRGVDAAVTESAKGMGMSTLQRLFRTELRLAWPVVMAGIRVSTVMIVGIAAIAAAVNGPGLGEDIFAGLARIGSPTAVHLVLGGTFGVIVIALALDGLLLVFGKLTTSRGLR